LEAALKGSDKADIDAKSAALSTAAQSLGEKMYADMQAQQASAAPEGAQASASAGAGAKPAEDDVVDADFKEVKDK
jgi:molecular chaperone DnaK